MHREIQIKQFPIVTTHWWPKTRNERFVWENQQYLYRFLPLVHNHVQVIWVRTHIRCVTCVCVRSGLVCARDHFWRFPALAQTTNRNTETRSFRVLGHQCVVTMGNCLIWISLCMFFFPPYRDSDLYLPLYDWQTRTVWPKNIKNWIYWRKKDTYILDALGVSW